MEGAIILMPGLFQTNTAISKNGKAKIGQGLSDHLLDISSLEADAVLVKIGTSREGLASGTADERLKVCGPNRIGEVKNRNVIFRVLDLLKDPLILLLMLLAIVSYFTEDIKAAAIISFMVLVSVSLRLFQELDADKAAEKLKAMVRTTCSVIRDGKKADIPLSSVVPGDIVALSAGDIVPADVRIISSKDLYLNQATLSGESMPVEKHALALAMDPGSILDLQNICFMGTNVESGTAVAIVISCGSRTYFGSIAESMTDTRPLTGFDRGIKDYTWLMIRFILILAPLVMLINGFTKGDWLQAFLFALSVVVGLTPEMLPMIVNVNLAKGARSMADKKVIVKKLNAIQNFGAMDILCTDKTGTLTQGKVILERHLDVLGNEEHEEVLKYAYLNSYYQTGLKNVLDEAVLSHVDLHSALKVEQEYSKLDEITFDFVRKRMSVVIQGKSEFPLLICKGAVEEVLDQCVFAEAKGALIKLDRSIRPKVTRMVAALNRDGFRVIAVAYKADEPGKKEYRVEDERGLILSGFIAFLDPPKESAAKAIANLRTHGIVVKVLTGDNELVSQNICGQVGLDAKKNLLGSQVEAMDDAALSKAVESTVLFSKLSPKHKERIILALKANGHTVGFIGDGINDSPALRAADVGISVDTAVDIAKESSSIILLEKSLMVLSDGVIEGRKVFGNIVKYVKMVASSNFGNMFSVIGASIFLPFLPMLPIQVLVNNMLYDLSQTGIPTDEVDSEWTSKPRKWDIEHIKKFILVIGPISSIFDYSTFLIMLFVFNAWSAPDLFHTGWFVESLISQTVIIHVIRTNKIPFLQSRASIPMILMTILVCAIGLALPLSSIGRELGFVELPLLYWPILVATIVTYLVVTQLVKNWFVGRYGYG